MLSQGSDKVHEGKMGYKNRLIWANGNNRTMPVDKGRLVAKYILLSMPSTALQCDKSDISRAKLVFDSVLL